jgi:dTDP-4-amino-4,6-dideoxygalactose transaminase
MSVESLKMFLDQDPTVKAVVVTHLYGQIGSIQEIVEMCGKYDIPVIEDCAQSFGARKFGKEAGSFGRVATFSFYPTKNLGALGDGGAVVTNNSELAEKLRAYANYGSSVKNKYESEQLGINRRLDSIQSAILNFNLSHLESWNGRRNEIAKIYINALADKYKILHQNQKSVWHHFVILVERRDELQQHLANSGIGTEIHYPKVAGIQYQTLKNNLVTTNWENASRISASALSLPISPWLKNEEIKDVISAIHFFR